MARVELSVTTGFYVSQSTPLVDKRVVNLYPTIINAESSSNTALFYTPGIREFLDTSSGASRGVIVFKDGTEYRVIGTKLYEIRPDGTFADRGDVDGAEDVSIASNGINIVIVAPDADIYFFTPGPNDFEVQSNPVFSDFGITKTVAFKDGFYIYTTDSVFFTGSNKDINDGKDFNALDFDDADLDPDLITKVHVNRDQLYIFGVNTTEIFQLIEGTSGFPYGKVLGGNIQKGCRAPNTVINFDDGFVFLGGDKNERPGIFFATGSSVARISNTSIEQIIHQNSAEDISKARASSYSFNGGNFAIFHVGNNTLAYNATSSKLAGRPQWFELQSGKTSGEGFQVWRAIHLALVDGEISCGDDRTGKVGRLDFDVFTEYGEEIERFFTTQPFIDKGDTIFSHEVELYMEVGVGNDDSEDPKMLMEYSDNQGRIFNDPIPRSMGRKGEYKTKVRWPRLGTIPNTRTFRFRTTDKVRVNIYSMFANAEVYQSG